MEGYRRELERRASERGREREKETEGEEEARQQSESCNPVATGNWRHLHISRR